MGRKAAGGAASGLVLSLGSDPAPAAAGGRIARRAGGPRTQPLEGTPSSGKITYDNVSYHRWIRRLFPIEGVLRQKRRARVGMNPVLDKGFVWFDAHVGLQDACKQRYRPCSWSPLLTIRAAEARDSRPPVLRCCSILLAGSATRGGSRPEAGS